MNSWDRPVQIFRFVATLVLALSAALFVFWTWHWPLLGDASLIHYICFLMDKGMTPYKDLGDMNMPGAFLIEWSVMHVLGGGDLAWRLYDFALLGVAALAIVVITLPYDWFAAVFASVLLALIHGRDGMSQIGQRDLTMAVLILAASASLIYAVRKEKLWAVVLFGIFSGSALTIKPTLLPLIVFLAVLGFYVLKHRQKKILPYVVGSFAAFWIAPLICLVFLIRGHVLEAFWDGLHGIVPYYASLGHRPLGYLLNHSISPLLPLVLLWVVIALTARRGFSWERIVLLAGMVFGLISYVIQARGYPYYRYPLLVFLLPLMAIDLCAALRRAGWRRWIAIVGVTVGALYLAPYSAYLTHQYEWRNLDFIDSLEADLKQLGGAKLSGHVQCIDSISGCGTTLYRMRLVQSTGVLSDFLLFGPSNVSVVQKTRTVLAAKLDTDAPTVLVVSSRLHIDGPHEFQKLQRWPEFQDRLAEQYCLVKVWNPATTRRIWSRRDTSDSYRIYLLRSSTTTCEMP